MSDERELFDDENKKGGVLADSPLCTTLGL
jgi:hypothetical protein